ncbi:hypothetical protein NKI41_32250, partial [Mesorhizobium sp. M0601]
MMRRPRRNSLAFKAKVAIAAISGEQSLVNFSRQFSNPGMECFDIDNWRHGLRICVIAENYAILKGQQFTSMSRDMLLSDFAPFSVTRTVSLKTYPSSFSKMPM